METPQKTGNRLAMLLLGASLAFGIMAAADSIANAMVRMRQQNTITVKGTAQEKILSNFATWRGEIVVRGSDLKEAYARIDEQRLAALAFLSGLGADAGELRLDPVDVTPRQKVTEKGVRTAEIEEYVLKQTIVLGTTNVLKTDEIARKASGLLSRGIEFHSDPPKFINTDLEAIKLRLLSRAASNAYERAAILAGCGGGKVGPLVSGSQGVFQITPPDSNEATDYGVNDATSFEKLAKAVVTLEFQVEHPRAGR